MKQSYTSRIISLLGQSAILLVGLWMLVGFCAVSTSAEEIFFDDFEGDFPGPWALSNLNGTQSNVNWGQSTVRSVSGAKSVYCATDGGSETGRTYFNNLITYMDLDLLDLDIDLAEYSDYVLTFQAWVNTEDGFDFLRVSLLEADETINWTTSIIVQGDRSVSGWQTYEVVFSDFVDTTVHRVGFDFISDESDIPGGDAGVWIDDVVLSASRITSQVDLEMTTLTVEPLTVTPTNKFTSCELDIFNRGSVDVLDLDVVIDFVLSSNQVFGDDDDIAIGDVVGEVDINVNAGTHLNFSLQGLGNMVRFWPTDLAEGDYSLFGNVTITNNAFEDPTVANNHFRSPQLITFNVPLEASYDGDSIETVIASTGKTLEVQFGADAAGVTGRVFKRLGGQTAFLSAPMNVSTPGTLTFPLGAGDLSIRGLEYYFEISSTDEMVRIPEGDGYFVFQMEMANMEVVTTRSGEYQMIGFPFLPTSTQLNQIFNELPDLTEDTWKFGRFDDATDQVDAYPALTSIHRGSGYWIVTDKAYTIRSTALSSLPNDVFAGDRVADIPVISGWNQIASPFAFNVATSAIRFGPNVEPVLHEYLSTGSYRTSSTMMPGRGYWVFNSGGPTSIAVPYVQATVGTAGNKPVANHIDGWQITLGAQSGDREDAALTVGTDTDARVAYDGLDVSEPPAIGRFVALSSLVQQNESGLHRLDSDLRPAGLDLYEFDLLVRGTTGEPVTLMLESQDNLPAKFRVMVIDSKSSQQFDLRALGDITLPGVPDRIGLTYKLRIGTDDRLNAESEGGSSVPRSSSLAQNYPNPFNAGTVITYTLAEPSNVSLEVFDVLGKRVVTLINDTQETGQYSVAWNGRNDDGRPAATGMYFYRLTTPDQSITKKMLLVK